jgi:hypothetical protein
MEFFMMKKTAIALGIAALTCGAQAAEVFKNADTAIEVNVDLQFYNFNVVDTANAMARNYLLGIGTQLQLKASKMIDADLTVFGQFETDPDPVGDNATFETDDMKFGLKSKSMGTIQVGQFDSYMEDELAEIAGAFIITGGTSTYGMTSEFTASNDGRHIMYSHKIGDFAFGFDFTQSTDKASAATDGSNGFAYTGSYTLGNLKVVAGASTVARWSSDTNSSTASSSSLAMNKPKAREAKGFGASYLLESGLGKTRFAVLTATNLSYSSTAAYDNLTTTYNNFSVNHTFGPWQVGYIGGVREAPAVSTAYAAATYNENAVQVVYDLGKGAKLYAATAQLGSASSLGNSSEVGFLMSF